MSEQTAFPQVQQLTETFRRLVDAQVSRLQTFHTEAGRLEEKVREGTALAVEEGARMVKNQLDLASQLSGEYRRLTLEATRRLTDLVAPRG
jgi:hypothetical protein